ncbi:MAG: hypothetical protein HYS04_06095 [Acidobacteria bacterium]|nr:hypothetical protein [Acidobacteriota bacterium]
MLPDDPKEAIMRQLKGAAILAAWTAAVGAAGEAGAPGPQPGDVYREFYVVMGRNKEWRVTDPDPENPRALANLPNPVLRLHVSTLRSARRAELLIDRWGGHPGTSGQRIRFNGNGWIPLPQLKTTPRGVNAACYMSQDNPIATIPLADLKEGINTLEGTAGDRNLCGALRGWGQWGWYGGILRVYYDRSMPHVAGRIVSPERGRAIGDHPEIRVETSRVTDRVDVLAWYDGYDENGDGVYEDWHGAYHYIDLAHHAGTSTRAPHRVRWDTTWTPDQRKGSVKLIARIRGADGVWFVTPPVEGLTLRRQGASVRLYRPLNVPARYQVRTGARMGSKVRVPDLAGAVEATVAVRTWNGYQECFRLNGHAVEIAGARTNYAFGLRPVPVSALRQGDNAIEFHSTTEDHSVEILWPGPALLVRYGAAAAGAPGREWLNGDYDGRFFVDITADSDIRGEKAIEIPLPAAARQHSFRVVAYQDGSGPAIHNGAVPWQRDADGTLTVLVSGLEAGRSRRLAVYFGKPQGLAPVPRVTVGTASCTRARPACGFAASAPPMCSTRKAAALPPFWTTTETTGSRIVRATAAPVSSGESQISAIVFILATVAPRAPARRLHPPVRSRRGSAPRPSTGAGPRRGTYTRRTPACGSIAPAAPTGSSMKARRVAGSMSRRTSRSPRMERGARWPSPGAAICPRPNGSTLPI